jgi:hypothetical protein
MKIRLIAAALAAAFPLAAAAATKCPDTPREKWLKPEEVQARLQSRGYDVRSVKSEGACYEVKATKDGKRVEARVNPADATVVAEKVKERS